MSLLQAIRRPFRREETSNEDQDLQNMRCETSQQDVSNSLSSAFGEILANPLLGRRREAVERATAGVAIDEIWRRFSATMTNVVNNQRQGRFFEAFNRWRLETANIRALGDYAPASFYDDNDVRELIVRNREEIVRLKGRIKVLEEELEMDEVRRVVNGRLYGLVENDDDGPLVLDRDEDGDERELLQRQEEELEVLTDHAALLELMREWDTPSW